MSWKSVPAELKDKIFTTVEAAFVIDPRSRKNVLQTAGISFRQFKNWLTTKYIIPHKDEPQLLQVPPEKYSFIEQNHWEEFVRSRLSETFQEKRKLQQDRRSKNKYNHRISRKGYANLKEEMKPYRIWDVWLDIWCNAPLCLRGISFPKTSGEPFTRDAVTYGVVDSPGTVDTVTYGIRRTLSKAVKTSRILQCSYPMSVEV
uniref:Serine/threonine-protein kinase nek2 n=1 Tax=Cucumis melo TaxID=3656 RepID=A0A9I9EB41_CUCME